MSAPGWGPLRMLVGWVAARRWRQGLVLVAVCAAVFLPRLGATGLSMSEGHRVIPAWEMLNDARAGEPHWLLPQMFGTAYLRKPPGVMWAIAASSAAFGENEFAARLPSAAAATLLVLAVWWFATRWFGSPWGLAAGLAQALLPVTWPSARSAEIESLHMLTTGGACLILVDQLMSGDGRRLRLALWGVAAFAASVAMACTKGPAGALFVLAASLAPVFVVALRRLEHRSLLGAFGLVAAPAVAGVGFAAWVWDRVGVRHEHPFEPAVVQGVTEFMWQPDRIPQVLLLGPAVLLTMMPAALAIAFPWGPDARSELELERRLCGGSAGRLSGGTAVALAWTCALSLLFLTAFGISNPRYGLPLCALVTPLVAYVARGAWGERGLKGPAPEESPGAFIGKRPRIARAMLLGSPLAWPAILLALAGVYVGVMEPDRRESSGREAGVALAAHLPDGAVVWADEVIEARPEVLLYAVREAERHGRRVRVRWLKPEFMPAERPEGLLLLLREDGLIDEVAWFTEDGRFGDLTPITRGAVHKYEFVLMRPTFEP